MHTFLLAAVIIFFYMNFCFILAIIKKRNDLADIFWGLGFVLISIFNLIKNLNNHTLLITILVILWGLRLTIYIWLRNKNKDEDARYKKWREEWGKNWILRTYFQVFILQGLFMYLISLPITINGLYSQNYPFSLFDIIGILMWLVGFFFETIGDWQLYKFKSNSKNKGKILKSGLWQYTRHPNYFGEATMWWGIFLISLQAGYQYLSIISPLTITILLTKVSGIPLIEAKYAGNKEFEEYKRKTSVFFPLPPKN